MDLNTVAIPSMPKRPSYINIVQLEKGRILSDKELEFLENIIPYINKDIFKSQNHYNIFIRRALRVYNSTVDQEAIRKVKELKGTNWEYSFLDRIDTDIFS